MSELQVGDRVCAGKGDDYDEGVILEILGTKAFVGWKSGVKTWTPISDLELIA